MDHLLTAADVARRLGISYMQFRRLRPKLVASGLRIVRLPSSIDGKRPTIRYQASSLDRLIRVAAEREAAIC